MGCDAVVPASPPPASSASPCHDRVQLNGTGEVIWENATDGRIEATVLVWPVPGAVPDARLTFNVRYHPTLYPDLLLEGTFPTEARPSAAWPVYPFCLEAGECKANSSVTHEVVVEGYSLHCNVGEFALDGTSCQKCAPGSVAGQSNATSCERCSRWRLADDDQARCDLNPALLMALTVGGLSLLLGVTSLVQQLDIVRHDGLLKIVGKPLLVEEPVGHGALGTARDQ